MKKNVYRITGLSIGLILVIYAVFFVFSGRLILPQNLNLGFFSFRFYGLIMALAAAAGYFLAMKRAGIYGLLPKEAERIVFWAVVLGFVFARLYHVASSYHYYLEHPLDIVEVWNGGLGIFGAMFGGVVLAVIIHFFKEKFLSNTKISVMSLLDWGAPGFALGQAIGRFGNLFNYEAFGYPTNLPWKMFVPEQFRPPSLFFSEYFHPLFLYESLGSLIILFLLLTLTKKASFVRAPGSLFFLYLFLYNILRFFIEFLRVDSTFIGQIRLNSITSGVLCMVGLFGLYVVKRRALIRQNKNT